MKSSLQGRGLYANKLLLFVQIIFFGLVGIIDCFYAVSRAQLLQACGDDKMEPSKAAVSSQSLDSVVNLFWRIQTVIMCFFLFRHASARSNEDFKQVENRLRRQINEEDDTIPSPETSVRYSASGTVLRSLTNSDIVNLTPA